MHTRSFANAQDDNKGKRADDKGKHARMAQKRTNDTLIRATTKKVHTKKYTPQKTTE